MIKLLRRAPTPPPSVVSTFPLFLPTSVELGGVVTEEQCRTLADYLSPSLGGQYLLPTACSRLLNKGDDTERAKVHTEDNGAEVYARLKRRPTVMAKEGFPPTMC